MVKGDDSYGHESNAGRQPEHRGKEVFDIQPIILGGDPIDSRNKCILSRDEHIRAVVYWNRIVREARLSGLTRVIPKATTRLIF